MQSTYLVPWSTLNCKPRLGDADGQGGLVKCKISPIFGFLGFCANLSVLCPHGISVGGCDLLPSPWIQHTTIQHFSWRTAINLTKGLLYQSPISLSATHMLIFKWIAPRKLNSLSPRSEPTRSLQTPTACLTSLLKIRMRMILMIEWRGCDHFDLVGGGNPLH